jgi:hypothetical protein
MGLSVLLLLGTAPNATAAARPASLTQTVRWLQPGNQADSGTYWISYTSLSLRSQRWSLRGSLSWLSWDAESPQAPAPSQSGLGAFYLTAGRKLWRSTSQSYAVQSAGWFRLRAKLPIEDAPSPLGSGEVDWGASLFTSTRWNRILVLAEAGYLDLGDPADFTYRTLASASVSASYRSYSFPLYPLASALVSSSSQAGDSAYAEMLAGVGLRTSTRTDLTALISKGFTDVTPDHGVALLVSWRP